ncbi:MAG: VC0807 family protein [Chloroflexota bacterium]
MNQPETAPQKLRRLQIKLALNLAINGFFPPLLYALLRPIVASDTIALALVSGVTAVRIVVGWIWNRKLSWISLATLLGLAVAVIVSQLLGGNPLPLKLHGPLITGLIGAALLISVIVRKPLFFPLLRLLARSQPTFAIQIENGLSDPENRRHLTIITAAIGLVLILKTAVDVLLALTLPTDSLLVVARLFNWGVWGSAALLIWWIRKNWRHSIELNQS